MTKSGTHDSDPYNFVEVAMRGFTGLTPISVFSTIGSTSKTVLFDQMDTMVKQGSQLLDLLKTSVEEQKLDRLDRKQERLDCNKRSMINSQIEIAKALGD